MKTANGRNPLKNLRRALLTAAIVAFIVIVMGGVLRSAGAGGSCPDWPTCFGSWLPPVETNAALDYTHRFTTLLLALALGWAGLEMRRVFRKNAAGDQLPSGPSLVKWAMIGSLGLFTAQVLLGGIIALNIGASFRPVLSALHLGLSLLGLGLLVAAAASVFYWEHSAERPRVHPRPAYQSPFARLSLLTLAALFLLLVSGSLVAVTGAGQACPDWPLCGSNQPGSLEVWINMAHRLVTGAAGLLVAVQFIQAWRTQRSQTAVLAASAASTVLFFSLALLGWVQVKGGFPMYMLGLHQSTAVAVWGAMVVQAVAVGMAGRTAEEEAAEAAGFAVREGGWRAVGWDLFLLTKPIVVALLLVTTIAGMVIGARAWPSLGLAFWTLLGGAMAAGGSGAINQYIDRVDDSKMQRTQKRPIPAGRLTPGEGLAFGIGVALASFYLMVVFTNLLAALLSLAGIIYYVLIYSILLKKTTTQNIVIGGGAGAIPPLVGWAAATGSLNIPSLLLFAVIFLWTPPHFWALAIVRARDYARAGVPMLPVVEGETKARTQIFIYTIELVALTLFLPVVGLGGSVYLISAVVLGGLLLYSAWKVLKMGGNKVAWQMYRHSSMYLAFLFLALMVDRLL